MGRSVFIWSRSGPRTQDFLRCGFGRFSVFAISGLGFKNAVLGLKKAFNFTTICPCKAILQKKILKIALFGNF